MNGLTDEEVKEIISASEWVDIVSKIGTMVAPSPSNVKIYYNSTLSLIFIRAFMRLESKASGEIPLYNFNNDLPGITATLSANAMFFYDGPCYVSHYKIGCIYVFPYAEGGPIREKTICIDGDDFDLATASFMIRFNNQFKQQFEQYLEAH